VLSARGLAAAAALVLAACGATRVPEPAELDGDRDGVLLASDACPDAPEDLDEVADLDGCPDPDDDADGIADVDDLCSCLAEDLDGFEDTDGCPDPDDDRDRIADACDRCPREPEHYNGTCDDDGCPDRGRLVCIEQAQLRILERIEFPRRSARLPRERAALLDALAATFLANPEIELTAVLGHAAPTERAGEALARARAEAVRDALVARGVAPERLLVEVALEVEDPADAARARAVTFEIRRIGGEAVEERHATGCGSPPPAEERECSPVPDCDPTPRDPASAC
jgi:outer membrane protein OmpA-like peptidoglycan-associated protein